MTEIPTALIMKMHNISRLLKMHHFVSSSINSSNNF